MSTWAWIGIGVLALLVVVTIHDAADGAGPILVITLAGCGSDASEERISKLERELVRPAAAGFEVNLSAQVVQG
jgi:hypothetical protein